MDEGVPKPGYDALYATFDTPLARRMRGAAYGKDVGQNSWASAEEIAEDAARLRLSAASRLLDLGCGAGGPLVFVAGETGCRALGLDRSAPAIASAQNRARAAGLDSRVAFEVADLDTRVGCPDGSFTAALAIDVVIHLADRGSTFGEVARLLAPGGRFLFTDAGVLAGPVSSAEVTRRSVNGRTTLVPPGTSEHALERAGFRLLESADRTPSLLARARGRLAARQEHHAELERVEGAARFAEQALYLETVIELAERGALMRWMYLAERV